MLDRLLRISLLFVRKPNKEFGAGIICGDAFGMSEEGHSIAPILDLTVRYNTGCGQHGSGDKSCQRSAVVPGGSCATNEEIGAKPNQGERRAYKGQISIAISPRLRSNLDQALKSLALPTNYKFIDADKLKPSDLRRGYGTPTVLYKDRDLFGKRAPSAPSGAPS